MSNIIDFEVAKFRRWARKEYGEEYKTIEKVEATFRGYEVKAFVGHYKDCECYLCKGEIS